MHDVSADDMTMLDLARPNYTSVERGRDCRLRTLHPLHAGAPQEWGSELPTVMSVHTPRFQNLFSKRRRSRMISKDRTTASG